MNLLSSPFTRQSLKTHELMRMVILCCIPGIAIQWYFFGWGNLIQIMLAVSACWVTEAVILIMRARPVFRITRDSSALLTGVLLGIALPPFLPWWMTVIAAVFAIGVVKHLYGGLGNNLFNPAMAGYVLLLISFPVAMTSWQPVVAQAQHQMGLWDSLNLVFTGFSSDGYSIQQARMTLDGITAATPLDTIKTDLRQGLTLDESQQNPVFGVFAGAGWEWVNLAFLLGGLYLIYRRVISWAIPGGMLLSLFVISGISFAFQPDGAASPMMHLFSGATMLGAFFIATDPVSACTTVKGRWIFGALIGAMVYAIRTWGGYPDAVAFSVLLANMSVMLIDYYCKPRTYGHKERQ
ncbi:electron transport complex subunit RsxD [Neiella marina]|uniref:Ion-translocating oxidoreductase complex subunit D n=1 Tax=Neiella holothuriorum TaxID=2870530 RepID=A0ABS7EEN7_9GAMM|nr:electron transport complex subunit RsxD [Neiella holothuriorum]MBW8190700.1 electron transport complex subunit RsxD [Neiella holothuriorum]